MSAAEIARLRGLMRYATDEERREMEEQIEALKGEPSSGPLPASRHTTDGSVGGEKHALDDPYVMDRARSALAIAQGAAPAGGEG